MAGEVVTALVSIGGSIVTSGVLVALVKRSEKRDKLTADVRKAEAREITAQHRLEDGAAIRHESREAELHDECREEVRKLSARVTKSETALARCDEQHAMQRTVNEDLLERLSRVELRSNPPPAAAE